MNLEKEVQTIVKDGIKYHRDRLKAVKSNRPTLEKLAQLLGGAGAAHIYVTTHRIDLDFDSTKRAREITGYLLKETDIGKFEKVTESKYNGLSWYYKADLDGVEVRVGPALPDRRCQPVKKEYTNSYWVCEPKGD